MLKRRLISNNTLKSKMKYLLALMFLLLLLAACTKPETSQQLVETPESKLEGYSGSLLAGVNSAKYLDFNKQDYEKALKENKKVLLYFYANWCRICKAEQQHTIAAFNQLNDPNLVGFRVNYKDSDTDADEEELAKQFGIPYQHTKVLLVDGKQVLKAPDSWNKERYLKELG